MSAKILERKALLGILAIGGFVAASIWEIGRRNFWFEAKATYKTQVEDADGLRIGSSVTISGLRVGEVAALDVGEDNAISVTMKVRKSVAARVRQDAGATIIRTFVIGEKRIDILPGNPDLPEMRDGSTIPAKDAIELAEFITGNKLGELMNQVEKLIAGTNSLIDASEQIFGKYKDGSFNKALGMIEPSLVNFLALSDDLIVMTKELRRKSKDLPEIVTSGRRVLTGIDEDFLKSGLARGTLTDIRDIAKPLAARQKLIESLLSNLEDMSSELKKNPAFTREILEALRELTITLKALQKTWLLEDKTEEVKKGG